MMLHKTGMQMKPAIWGLSSAVILTIAMAIAAQPAGAQNAAAQNPTQKQEQPKGKAFATADAAADALYVAAKQNDEQALMVILGPDAKEIIMWSDDPRERQEQRHQFADKYEQMHRLSKEPDSTMALYVGAENWPLPIPLVEYNGAWYFEAEMGRQEIMYRRIGRNEVEALEVCHALVDAEKEYHASSHQYTVKFVSDGSSHDGLYWQSDGASKSPIGPYLAHAGVSASGSAGTPYHGYHYKIVMGSGQGGSFAVLAFPAMYRSSGVMTFLMNENGDAYEKDLGKTTATAVGKITSSTPDATWKKAE
jgi:Protein of unknown function (DUF2950)